MTQRLGIVAAAVNALIVLLLPGAASVLASSLGVGAHAYSVTVHPPGWSPVVSALGSVVSGGRFVAPFAVLTFWRTYVHATRRIEHGVGSWRGVAEAGTCGLATSLVVLLPGIVSRPLDAAPYVIFYGSASALVGLALGVLLHATALLVLRLGKAGAAPTAR